MPNIKETYQILESTPIDQAVLLNGIHGIGKSEIVTGFYKNKSWKVVPIFLGQMSDAGDVLGLPKYSKDENGNDITTFAPPSWWPQSMEESILIFLDEINRAKPELMQCIMDMVLNRKLNGRDLPPNTKIVAAKNPLNDDGYYQVDELDPALIDRFNVYDFKPSVDEWLDWALKEKLHRWVIGFISKRNEMLDPKIDLGQISKKDIIQPSRRSWKRISDILNKNPNIDLKLFLTMCLGIIGDQATIEFKIFIQNEGKGLHAGKIITSWDSKTEAKILTMGIQEIITLNREICIYLDEHCDDMKKSTKVLNSWGTNIKNYLETINPEAMASFYDDIATANSENKAWPSILLDGHPSIAQKFVYIMQGKDEPNWED